MSYKFLIDTDGYKGLVFNWSYKSQVKWNKNWVMSYNSSYKDELEYRKVRTDLKRMGWSKY